jgi:uncharacterized protein (TIGR03083 family)
MDHDACCQLIESEVERMVDAVAASDPSAAVPGCPEWTVADLARHVGGVHRWAAHHVRTLAPERVPAASIGISPPDDAADLRPWLIDGGATIVGALREADPDAPVWAWGADQHVRFWSRRMVHETTVHRVDAEQAAGRPPAVDAVVAADGIDELLENLPCAAYFSPGVEDLRGDGESLALVATDHDAGWRIVLLPDRYDWSRADGSAPAADVTVSGPVLELLLAVYRRRSPDDGGVAVEGDRSVLDRWLASSAL